MKKFFANLVIILSVLATSVVAVPFTAVGPVNWNIPSLAFLTEVGLFNLNNEILIKAGIGGAMFLFSLIFWIISLVEYSRNDQVEPSTALAAFIPMFLFGIFGLTFGAGLAAFTYRHDPTYLNLGILAGLGVMILNLIFLGHLLLLNFRRGKNFTRIMMFFLLIEIMGMGGGAAYYLYTTFFDYQGQYTKYYVGIVAGAIVFYVVHLIILSVKAKRLALNHELGNGTSEAEAESPRPVPNPKFEEIRTSEPKPAKMTRVAKAELQKEQLMAAKGKKATIVSKEQTILSGEQNVDPTNLLYEEVNIDPEFNKTTNMDKQVSSIEYYIEKPKMFKPMDPTFDVLVAYVRELPNVVTKISDERITFYVDRKPFLVLMNFGNYYRMAFRSDLEKGVRLIIKYPTISKNKGTKDALWFKANNYGDLPKEVIYEIVKSAFDNVNA